MGSYTGVGAIFAISAGASFTGRVSRIGEFTRTREALDDTALDQTICRRVVPDDLDTNEPIDIEYFWDDTNATQIPVGIPCLLTLTFPIQGTGSAATLVGTGFFTSESKPSLEVGVRTKGGGVWQFDGVTTKPTFTPGT